MKLNVAIPGLLMALLASCSGTNQNNTLQSTPQIKQTSEPRVVEPTATPNRSNTSDSADTPIKSQLPAFDSVSFPQETCGDHLLKDVKTDTVKFYPVFIDYSENNLQAVKAKFCRDAFKKRRKDNDKEAIQVASFVSEERANKFKEFLVTKLSIVSNELKEPTVIAVKPTGDIKNQGKKANDSTNISNSVYSIGKAAKLTFYQIKELIEMEKKKAYKGLGSQEEVKAKFVVPTYLPPGFHVSHFSTNYTENLGGRYTIVYCNSSRSCFRIEGGIPLPIGDEPISYETTKEISSPALGKVKLGYVNYDRTGNKPYIGFAGLVNQFLKDNNEYIFDSGDFGKEQAITLNEAVKIVESLQYLNP
jgi:hypothetical protein